MAAATSLTHVSAKPHPYARFVGRVGSLAVALGVGAAVATGYGIGIASADPESSSDSTQSDSSATADAGATDSGTTASATPDKGSDSGSSGGDSDGGSTGTSDGTGMSFSSSGGVDSSRNDAGQHTDTTSDSTDDGSDVVAEAETPKPEQPKPEQPPVSDPKPAESTDTPAQPAKNDAPKDIPHPKPVAAEPVEAQQTVAVATPAAASDLEPVAAFSAKTLSSNDVQRTTVTTAVAPAPTAQAVSLPGAIVNIAAAFVGALLSPFLAPGPAAPAEPPLLWAALAWIRNEVRRTFFNGTPTATADAATTPEDTSLTIDVLGNDTDPEGDQIYVTSVTQPTNGTVTRNADGTLTYTPKADWSGTETFTYTARDRGLNVVADLVRLLTGQGPRTTTATVTVAVTPVNAEVEQTLPVDGVPSGIEVGTLPDGTIRGYVANADKGTVTELDYDAQTDRWIIGDTIDVGRDPGKIIVTADRTYVHNRGDGTVSVIDRLSRRELTRVDVGDITDIAVSEKRSIDAGIMYAIDRDGVLSAYDTDEYALLDQIDLRLEAVNARAAAAVVLTGSPKLAMRADGRVYASVGTRVVAVDARRALAARGMAEPAAARQLRIVDSVDVSGEVTALRASADGRRLLAGVSAQTESGARLDRLAQVRLDGPTMDVSRSIDLSVGGIDAVLLSDGGDRGYVSGGEGSLTTVDLRDLSVTEKVRTSVGAQVALVPGRDRLLVTDVAARKITVLSDPVAVPISTANDTATVVEDHSVEINVLANDSVGGAESPTVRVVTGPANGTVEVSGSGTLTYTPNRDFFGTDAITYNVVDGETSSNVATVVVTVNPLDDPTVIVLDWDAVTDLDSHLTGPGPDGTRFHVFFQNLTHDEDGADPVDVELFNDDLTGVTVETTQINVLRPGDYHFYVRNFTRASVSGTGAKVVVTDVDDPELNVTFVAGGAPGQYWSVFKLTVSTTGAVTITPIDTYGDTEPTLDLVDA